jgi:hypothetical protein
MDSIVKFRADETPLPFNATESSSPLPKSKYLLRADQLLPLCPGRGGCFASDLITVRGRPVGVMVRDIPVHPADSDWRFFAGPEYPNWIDEPESVGLFDVNVLANYDPAIIPLLDEPTFLVFKRNGLLLAGTYRPGATLDEEESRWQAILAYLEASDIICRRHEPGGLLMSRPLDIEGSRFREIASACPVRLDLEFECTCCGCTANQDGPEGWTRIDIDERRPRRGPRKDAGRQTKAVKLPRRILRRPRP